MNRKELIRKKFETILKIQDWYEKLQREKNKSKQKEIENTIKQLEANLIKIIKELEKMNTTNN